MACSEGHKLQEYLEDELTLPERARLEEHLSRCASCRQELAELEQLGRLLAELAPQRPPRGFVGETLLKARQELAPSRRYQPVRGGLVAATSAAAALLVFVLQFNLAAPAGQYLPAAAVAPVASLELAVAAPVVHLPHLLAPASARQPKVAFLAARPRIAAVRLAERRLVARPPVSRAAAAALAVPPAEGPETRAAAAYVEATRHAAADPELSIAALENVAAAYPDSRQAAKSLLTAADLQRRGGATAEADGTYRRVLALRGSDGLSAALAHKGLAELRRDSVGEDEVALYHYAEAARSLRHETAGQKPAAQARALVVLADIEKSLGQRDRAAADYAAVANSGVHTLAADQTTSALAEVL